LKVPHAHTAIFSACRDLVVIGEDTTLSLVAAIRAAQEGLQQLPLPRTRSAEGGKKRPAGGQAPRQTQAQHCLAVVRGGDTHDGVPEGVFVQQPLAEVVRPNHPIHAPGHNLMICDAYRSHAVAEIA